MKPTIRLILLSATMLAASLLIMHPAAAQPSRDASRDGARTMFVTYDGAPLYDSASYLSTVLGTLRLGDSVAATGRSGDYLRVTHGSRSGYVLAANLGATPPKRAASKRGAAPASRPAATDETARKPVTTDAATTESSATREEPPGAATTSSPAGTATGSSAGSGAGAGETAASVQCRALTKSGKQCSRRTNDPSGYCWQHKK